MAGTHFKSMVYSMGTPLTAGGMPAISGKWFFVHPVRGLDSNSGKDISHPLKTLSKAYSLCTSGAGDGICIISSDTGTSGSTTVYEGAVLDWAKCGITVWGMCAPVVFGHRARIANKSTATALPYILDVQGHNNAFYNLQIANWGTNAACLSAVKVSGERNAFINCSIVNGGQLTAAKVRDLWLTGSDNTFKQCTFGTSTVIRNVATAANVMFNGAGSTNCQDNYFEDCYFKMLSANASAGFIRSESGASMSGINVFNRCLFVQPPGGGATISDVVIGTEPTTDRGVLAFFGCGTINVADNSDWTSRHWVSAPASASNGAGGIGQLIV